MRPPLSSFHTRAVVRAFLLSLALAAAATQTGAGLAASTRGQVSDSATPATILRNAKVIYIRKESVFFKPAELENELLKRPEFQRWGLTITRNEADADLILEVSRKVFTRFVYTVLDRRTNTVVASGKLSSLGGTLSTKVAKRFVEQMRRVRQ
jgi:hypothetical protein